MEGDTKMQLTYNQVEGLRNGTYYGPSITPGGSQTKEAYKKALDESKKANSEVKTDSKDEVKARGNKSESLTDLMNKSNDLAKQQTIASSIQDSGTASLNASNAFNATGMNKAMAASLGEATLSGNATNSYLENIDTNKDNQWNQAIQQATLALKAQESEDKANYLEEAAEVLSNSEKWGSVGNGAGVLSGLVSSIMSLFNS